MAIHSVPRLGEDDVRAWVGETYAARGLEYFRNGHVFHTWRGPAQLRAFCTGGRPEPYRVRVFFEDGRIRDSRCSCPIGRACKHVAALLYAWIYRPEIFEPIANWEERLGALSREQLLATILSLVEHDPHIEETFAAALDAFAAPQRGDIDPAPFRAQADRILEQASLESARPDDILDSLTRLVDMAHVQRQMGNAERAAAIFQGLLEAVLAEPDSPERLRGPLLEFVQVVGSELADTLARLPAGATRERTIRVLLDLYTTNLFAGRNEFDAPLESALIAHTTDAERTAIAARLRRIAPAPPAQAAGSARALPAAGSERARGGIDSFLHVLEAGPLDNDALLEFFRRTDRWPELVERLLATGKLEAATTEVRHAPLWEVPALADLLVEHGEEARAVLLVRERIGESYMGSLAGWLVDFYGSRGHYSEALEWARRRLQNNRTADHYLAARHYARKLGVWSSQRPALLKLLARSSPDEHIKALLGEGLFDRAAAVWQEYVEAGQPLANATTLRLAEQAERRRPALAVRLYIEFVESLISKRNRAQYQLATVYLARIQRLYEASGQHYGWQTLMNSLVEEYRRRWALLEELERANLLER